MNSKIFGSMMITILLIQNIMAKPDKIGSERKFEIPKIDTSTSFPNLFGQDNNPEGPEGYGSKTTQEFATINGTVCLADFDDLGPVQEPNPEFASYLKTLPAIKLLSGCNDWPKAYPDFPKDFHQLKEDQLYERPGDIKVPAALTKIFSPDVMLYLTIKQKGSQPVPLHFPTISLLNAWLYSYHKTRFVGPSDKLTSAIASASASANSKRNNLVENVRAANLAAMRTPFEGFNTVVQEVVETADDINLIDLAIECVQLRPEVVRMHREMAMGRDVPLLSDSDTE